MSQVITLSDSLYARLQAEARSRGLSSVEQLIEDWQADGAHFRRRRQVVSQIDALRKRLQATYGEMPDSVDLIRSDRAR
jgi:hypothetical protein